MKEDKIKQLLEKYYRGETSLEEEQALRETLKEEKAGKWEDDRMIFALFSEAEDQAPEMMPFYHSTGAGKRTQQKTATISWYFAMAASVSLLIGLAAGFYLGSGNRESQIAGLREDIREIKAMTTANKLRDASASERILAAYEVQNVGRADDETISALINTLNIDENVNVRIAAADALFRFGDQDVVRKAFIEALSSEEDANLQIRLINMLVMLNEMRALPKLEEMMNNMDQLPVVRQTAAQGISQLL